MEIDEASHVFVLLES